MSGDEFDELALCAELTSDCGFCGLLQFPMSVFNDCARGNSDQLGIDMRGDGWRLMRLGASITVYCGYCGRKDPSCRNVPLESWRPEELERKAAACGWTVGVFVGRSTPFEAELAIYTVVPSSPDRA